MKNLETLLKDYADHVAERAAKGIPPLPLNAEQTNCITKLLEQDSTYDSSYLLDLLINRVPPGVDEAAYIKASWLTAIINSEKYCKLIKPTTFNICAIDLVQLLTFSIVDVEREMDGKQHAESPE